METKRPKGGGNRKCEMGMRERCERERCEMRGQEQIKEKREKRKK